MYVDNNITNIVVMQNDDENWLKETKRKIKTLYLQESKWWNISEKNYIVLKGKRSLERPP